MKSQLILLAIALACGAPAGRGQRHRQAALILLAIALACYAAFVFAQPDDVEPVWHTDWREAQRLAHKTHKPIFAVLVCKH
jgi:hypothetical protein